MKTKSSISQEFFEHPSMSLSSISPTGWVQASGYPPSPAYFRAPFASMASQYYEQPRGANHQFERDTAYFRAPFASMAAPNDEQPRGANHQFERDAAYLRAPFASMASQYYEQPRGANHQFERDAAYFRAPFVSMASHNDEQHRGANHQFERDAAYYRAPFASMASHNDEQHRGANHQFERDAAYYREPFASMAAHYDTPIHETRYIERGSSCFRAPQVSVERDDHYQELRGASYQQLGATIYRVPDTSMASRYARDSHEHERGATFYRAPVATKNMYNRHAQNDDYLEERDAAIYRAPLANRESHYDKRANNVKFAQCDYNQDERGGKFYRAHVTNMTSYNNEARGNHDQERGASFYRAPVASMASGIKRKLARGDHDQDERGAAFASFSAPNVRCASPANQPNVCNNYQGRYNRFNQRRRGKRGGRQVRERHLRFKMMNRDDIDNDIVLSDSLHAEPVQVSTVPECANASTAIVEVVENNVTPSDCPIDDSQLPTSMHSSNIINFPIVDITFENQDNTSIDDIQSPATEPSSNITNFPNSIVDFSFENQDNTSVIENQSPTTEPSSNNMHLLNSRINDVRNVGTFSKDEEDLFKEGIISRGWGDWVGIAKYHVLSRSNEQIRMHAGNLKRRRPNELKILLKEYRIRHRSLQHKKSNLNPVDDVASDPIEDGIDDNDLLCYKCSSGDGILICCEGCTISSHLKCASPVLNEIPDGDWFCHNCYKSEYEQMRDERIARNRRRLVELGLDPKERTTSKRWTTDDDKALYEAVCSSVTSVDQFRLPRLTYKLASEKTGRSVSACNLRWCRIRNVYQGITTDSISRIVQDLNEQNIPSKLMINKFLYSQRKFVYPSVMTYIALFFTIKSKFIV
ncbi:hypothetical protein ACHAXA_001576 [Cyclostephanos tholiformis]|uniref:PHD-type domain-containing protein n=1 Tax=Cyclostephanos tholiformis TaxID=382380 RepID=A0ABD3RFW5_9STRA